jgi:hypothetical protein
MSKEWRRGIRGEIIGEVDEAGRNGKLAIHLLPII